jgi:hypothetical protein
MDKEEMVAIGFINLLHDPRIDRVRGFEIRQILHAHFEPGVRCPHIVP